ncbi:proton pump-interactor 1-like [Vicia villosa]|uniref:proton pump-interactor 1-like n=1 Tax=Vicia villosa TaxID=3911 RepID=UPI00273C607F|nr:proton pump-interactor 1-like [Vicia villosa]
MENKAIDENSGHDSKLVHQFYFVKLWPTVPDSISQIKKEEKVTETMNRDISKITDKIAKKMYEDQHLEHVLKRKYTHSGRRKNKELMDFNMALDELNLRNVKVENGGWFGEKLDKSSLNYLRLHRSKSLSEEKKIMRDIKIQQTDVSPFKSLEVLKETLLCSEWISYKWRFGNLEQMIRENYYSSGRLKLVFEIEQFQIQNKERASLYDSIKKTIKEQIKLLRDDDSLENRRERKGGWTRNKPAGKNLVVTGELYSLRQKLDTKYQKKDEARQRILKLDQLYHEEILHYNKHCSFMNKVHQLAEEKDVAALDEISHSEVGKFMLEWNNNKSFREDYKKKFLQSLERRQLSRDGRRISDKSCISILL